MNDAADAKKLFTEDYRKRIDEVCRAMVPDDIAERLRPSQSYCFYVGEEHFRPFTVLGCRRLTEDDRGLIQHHHLKGRYLRH